MLVAYFFSSKCVVFVRIILSSILIYIDLDMYIDLTIEKGYPALDIVSGREMVPIYRFRQAEQGAILLPIALSAFYLFTQLLEHRLHKCKNDRCILFFYDTTKSTMRQWCSLEWMNRARSLQHYQHIKKEHSV